MHALAQILKTQLNVAESDVEDALKIKHKSGGDVGEILCRKMVISEHQLLEARGIQFQLPVWQKIPLENIQRDFTQKVPIQFLKKYNMLPLEYQATAADPSAEPPENDAVHGKNRFRCW